MEKKPEKTPMMIQYQRIKDENPDCFLFFRLGDFYELFNEDAKKASAILDLTLTTRSKNTEKGGNPTPMCGVPYHSAEAYIARLIERGYKVAICEQTEDPAQAKGLVNREVVRVITPGTVLESSLLEEDRNNFICSVYLETEMSGLCAADISTGEVYATQIIGRDNTQNLIAELGRFSPREAILNDGAMSEEKLISFLKEKLGCLTQAGGEVRFSLDTAEALAQTVFQVDSIHELGLDEKPGALHAIGGLLSYLRAMSKGGITPLGAVNVYEQNKFMELDYTARRNLELTEGLRSGEKKGTLLWVLEHTYTAMGSRLLRSWLDKPLLSPIDIMRRQHSVAELVAKVINRGELRGTLKGLPDIERLIARVMYGTANGRDLKALGAACLRIPIFISLLEPFTAAMLAELQTALDPLSDIAERLSAAIVDEPPFSIREGGIIREGYNADVDRLRSLMSNARGTVAAMEAEQKEKTGIKSLKVGYNKVFGYYIEVSKSYYSQVPENYIRRQTLSSSERYITPELKEMEETILTAQDKLTALEGELFEQLRKWLMENSPRLRRVAQVLAHVDVLASLAESASRFRYTMPVVDFSDKIEITDGRHPVVERMLDDGVFVANDTALDGQYPSAIITGPNMAGKSTYMRQTALIVLMAQIGSFVPAKSARIGSVDRIFTRIGAQDDLAAGRSTFMVEMSEVADILRYATRRSLIILDEVGRGTSTFDGMSVARAVLEHIHKEIGAKTLFATHYHELVEMSEELRGIRNYNVAVKKRGDDIIFLRRIVPGGADDSFGVEVAKLAGLPSPVINRAKEVLAILEGGLPVSRPQKIRNEHEKDEEENQLSMAHLNALEIARQLAEIDITTVSPIEAMNILYTLHRKAGEIK